MCPFAMSFSMRGTRSSNTASATGPARHHLRSHRRPHQCRKCRSPVNTIASPSSSAVSMTFSSPTDAARLHHHRHAGGRGRLDAVGERVERVRSRTRRRPRGPRPSCAAISPTRPGSAGPRRCRPPGRPSPARSRSTSRARRCATPARRRATRSVGGALGDDPPRRRGPRRSGAASCTRNPPEIWRKSRPERLRAGASSRRVFLRFLRSASIVPVLVAGRDHHVGLRARHHALRRSRRRPGGCSATMPPNAERSSHSSARRYAVARSSATATPHGLACLMIAHRRAAVTDGDRARRRHAASAS